MLYVAQKTGRRCARVRKRVWRIPVSRLLAFATALFAQSVCGTEAGTDDSLDLTNVTPSCPMPLLLTTHHHTEPNKRLFISVEPGYFEAVSACLHEMSTGLAAIDLHASLYLAWLHCDIVYHRNRHRQTGDVVNRPEDTGIETFTRTVADEHEVAYHTHRPAAIATDSAAFYASPDSACTYCDTRNLQRWSGAGADSYMHLSLEVFEFDLSAGPGYDRMRGYYVGLDTRKLYLGKMENNWQPLAEFDLDRLDCKVMPGVWNLIRVAVEGPRIRVWLNRMHPSADPDRGLRIDLTDKEHPILSGAIGVRAHLVPAWFDNVVVLPVDAVP